MLGLAGLWGLAVPDMFAVSMHVMLMFVAGAAGWIQILGGRVPLHGGWGLESRSPDVQSQRHVGGCVQGTCGHFSFIVLQGAYLVYFARYVEFCTQNVWTVIVYFKAWNLIQNNKSLARLAPTGGPLDYLKLPHSQGTLNTLWFSPA